MSEIFSPKQRYELWLRIELTVSEGWAELGEIPGSVLERLRQARVDPDHIARLEERVGHDVVAFLDSLADSIGGEDARYLHRGLTSSDVLDTALALQLVQAADILLKDVDRLSSVIRRRAVEERGTLMAGRTHGIHAEPLSFGFVLAGWLGGFWSGMEKTTFFLMIAAIARWPLALVHRNPIRAALLSYLFLLVLAVYDLWSTRKVHRATLWAGAFLIFVQQVRIPIGKTAAWHAFASWAQSLAR